MYRKFIFLMRSRLDKRRSIKGNEIHHSVVLPEEDRLDLGSYIYIGPSTFLDGKGNIRIGDGTVISSQVCILSSSHVLGEGDVLPYGIESKVQSVVIGKGCWIGIRAILMPGIALGDGVVVGAGSVVTKSFPNGSIIAGNPAKLIGRRSLTKEAVTNSSYLLKLYGKGRRS